MAHTSFLFIAISAGYFFALTNFLDKIKRPQVLTGGLLAYAATIGMIVVGTIGQSAAIETDRLAGAHIEIWINGFSWLACGASAALLLISFLPPVVIQDKQY